MERQRTFADLERHHDKKTTRREGVSIDSIPDATSLCNFRKLMIEKGIAKNRERLLAAYASANLYMLAIAGRRLCPLQG